MINVCIQRLQYHPTTIGALGEGGGKGGKVEINESQTTYLLYIAFFPNSQSFPMSSDTDCQPCEQICGGRISVF